MLVPLDMNKWGICMGEQHEMTPEKEKKLQEL